MRRSKPRSNRLRRKANAKQRCYFLPCSLFIIAVAYGIYWFLVLRHIEETDDAYVAGNQVQIMAQVSGSVTKVWADNTDFVKEGDVLVTLDQTDAKQAFERAKTALASSVRQTHQLMINSKQLQANIDVQKTALAQAQSDLNRRVPLVMPILLAGKSCNTPAMPSPARRHSWMSPFNSTMPTRQ
ncbi:multidrug resistance secretion protein [Salmonella enterica subsp. enterica]|nr:multidrug resistance secretion protein [Salmonella enterica subsp. enterica]